MASGKNIYKVLVAGANDKTFALLQTLLPGSSYDPPLRAGSAGEAKRMALTMQWTLPFSMPHAG